MCCYKPYFEKKVFPKYKVCGVEVSMSSGCCQPFEYIVTLHFVPAQTRMRFFESNSYVLRSRTKPDENFLMQYVYGSLVNSMTDYHALAHLIKDNISEKITPHDVDHVVPSMAIGVPPSRTTTQGGDFGTVLSNLKSSYTPWCGGCITKSVDIQFYQDVIVTQAETKGCCNTNRSKTNAIPKYKICGVEVSTSSSMTPRKARLRGAITFLGLIIIILNLKNADGLIFGILILIAGAVGLLLPMCGNTRYDVTLHFLPATGSFRANSYVLSMGTKPEDNFLLQYVYGSLGSSMSGYHALSHLVGDNLTNKINPKGICAIVQKKPSRLSQDTE